MANYDRFWELHVTGVNGFYDFAPSIADQERYQLATHGATLTGSQILVNPTQSPGPCVINSLPVPPMGLPAQGYVSSCIGIQDLASGARSANDQVLTTWINDGAHIGKLRVNAHGNGMGQIGMADGTGPLHPVHYRDADAIVIWLLANGLAAVGGPKVSSLAGNKNSRGLVTLNLAVCMGARYDTQPATLNWSRTNSSPANDSAAHRIVTALTGAGLKGIEVTASNEITMDGASGVSGQWGRTFGLGGGQAPCMYLHGGDLIAWDIQKAGQGVQIIVPDGWTVSANLITPGGTISPPAGFNQWNRQGATPSAGWHILNNQGDRIEVPAGWLVDGGQHTILPPLGFKLTSNGKGRGGVISSIPDAPFTGMGQRLAHSVAKTRSIS